MLETHGRIDVLVNNAGMVVDGADEDFCGFQDLTEEQWDFGIAINLKTPVPDHRAGRRRA